MPSLVIELDLGVYSNIKGVWKSYDRSKQGELSSQSKINRAYSDVLLNRNPQANLFSKTLSVGVGNAGNTNCRLICEKPGASVFADFDNQHNIIISVRYSGCAHIVYRLRQGQIVVLHVYRGGGQNADELVDSLADYANGNGWTRLHTVATRGVQSNTQGCGAIVAISERYGQYVRSILAMVGAGGSIVGTSTPEVSAV